MCPFLYVIQSVSSFSCHRGCLLLPSRVSSHPPGCLLLPSRVSSLVLQGVFSCPPGCLLLPSRVSSLVLQGVFSCPPGCFLLPSRVSSLALQSALQDGFLNAVVSGDVAKPGDFSLLTTRALAFIVDNKGSCFHC